MRIELRILKITNFRSYYGSHELDLTSGHLCAVTGENNQHPALGSNGAGKSTIWDALSWGLFGKTGSGLKNTAVAPAGEEKSSTEVVVNFVIDGVDYRLMRGRNPTALGLAINGVVRAVTQTEVDKLLGTSFRVFHASVSFNLRRTTTFLEMPMSERVSLLSELLDLDFWLGLSETARNKAAELSNVRTDLLIRIGGLKAKEAAAKNSYLDARTRYRESKQRRDEVPEDKDFVARCLKARKVHKLCIKMLSELEGRKSILDKRRLEEEAGLMDSSLDLASSRRELKILKESFNLWYNDKCPTCGQSITRIRDDKLEELRRLQSVNQRAELTALKAIQTGGKALEALDSEIMELVRKIRELDTKRVRCETLIERFREEAAILKRWQEERVALCQKLRDELAEAKKSWAFTAEDRISVELRERSISREHSRYHEWVRGFKHVRVHALRVVVKMLQSHANAQLAMFGVLDGRLEMVFEEKKSGPRIVVSVLFEDGTVRSIEELSGGEKKRYQLACALGLVELLSSRGSSWSTEVWDEPSDSLNPGGVEKLMEVLRERALAENKTIFISDHNPASFAGFDRFVRVVKDQQGHSILT
jgi:DNA repair exonuclease SbcCD ATPase subunit